MNICLKPQSFIRFAISDNVFVPVDMSSQAFLVRSQVLGFFTAYPFSFLYPKGGVPLGSPARNLAFIPFLVRSLFTSLSIWAKLASIVSINRSVGLFPVGSDAETRAIWHSASFFLIAK
ncbi:MAG: hypothetical protein ABSE04_03510 [Candidatus Microgenomates bacterium]